MVQLLSGYRMRRPFAMETNVFEDLLGVLAEENSIDPESVRAEALRLYLNTHPSLKLDGILLLWTKGRG
jgi:hypothetical protein